MNKPELETSAIAIFDYHPRTRLVFGINTVDQAGQLAHELSARRILLVTDRGIVAAGHASRVEKSLVDRGMEVICFDQVQENPTTRCIDNCVAVARQGSIDTIVGLGGGSSIDTAKGCNFILTNGGRMQDYWGVGKAAKPMLPLIAIPTTAGTGSECQSYALIADENTHQKMACGDPKAAARIAILDPALTASQPPRVTCCTGIDAIAHALETAVTKRRNPLSAMYSCEAFRLAMSSFHRVVQNPNDLESRGRMLLAAAFAGTAIENSMLGAAHAAANPLTARFGIIHGEAVGMMLPAVVRFNAQDSGTKLAYAQLASNSEFTRTGKDHDQIVEALVKHLEWLLNLAGLPRSLVACGVAPSAIPELAREAYQQWTAGFNPRRVEVSDFEALYSAAMEERREGSA